MRSIQYFRYSFVDDPNSLGNVDLAAQCARWLQDVANVRVHGPLHGRLVDRWLTTEYAAFQPLAARPYQWLLLLASAPPVRIDTVAPRVTVERRGLGAHD